MNAIPNPATLTSAPLRHRLRVALNAPVADVWALVGDHTRLPEYSAGIERVDVMPGGSARVCYFRSADGGTGGPVLRELIRWEATRQGYSASADVPNDFGLTNDLSLVTVAQAPEGTLFTWEQYYDHPDLPVMRAGFDEGIADIGERLVARFGGQIVEGYVDAPPVAKIS